jgi:hypothetical protein
MEDKSDRHKLEKWMTQRPTHNIIMSHFSLKCNYCSNFSSFVICQQISSISDGFQGKHTKVSCEHLPSLGLQNVIIFFQTSLKPDGQFKTTYQKFLLWNQLWQKECTKRAQFTCIQSIMRALISSILHVYTGFSRSHMVFNAIRQYFLTIRVMFEL